MKRFTYKVYDRFGKFKTDITPIVSASGGFSCQLNGGQSDMTIEVKVPIDWEEVIRSDIVKVFVFSEKFKDGKLLYCGTVNAIERTYRNNQSNVSLRLVGIFTILSKNIENERQIDGRADRMLQNIIAEFNSVSSFQISTKILEQSNEYMEINLNGNFLDAIKKICDTSERYFYFLPDGTLIIFNEFDEKIRLSLDREIIEMKIEDRSEDICNAVRVDWKNGSVYEEDLHSQKLFGKFYQKIDKTELRKASTAQKHAKRIIEKSAFPKPKITLQIRDSEDVAIEEILPGMRINILNTTMNLNNLRVWSVAYNTHYIDVELSYFDSFNQEFLG